MSMISAQCDELRDAAVMLKRVTNGIRSGVPASTWHGMTYVFDSAAKSLRQAADTIWELRCKLAFVVDQSDEIERLKAENAKLRDAMYTNAKRHALQHMDEDELRIWATQQSEYIEELKELVRAFDWCTENFDLPNKCDSCPLEQRDKLTPECEVRMRELGIEDDE